jgi:anti-sigma B factor antagonist
MTLTTSRTAGAVVLRIDDARLTYPSLSDFASTATALIGAGERHIVIDLGAVGYVDSAAIGCLMDLHRQASAAGGVIKLASLQKRVETMLTMTGAHHFLEVHPDQASALASFGG